MAEEVKEYYLRRIRRIIIKYGDTVERLLIGKEFRDTYNVVAKNPKLDTRAIAAKLKISPQLAMHRLRGLEERGYVTYTLARIDYGYRTGVSKIWTAVK